MSSHQTFPDIVYKTKIVDNFLNSEEINYLQQCPKPWGTQKSDNSNLKCLPFLISYPEVNDFYNHLFEKIKKEIDLKEVDVLLLSRNFYDAKYVKESFNIEMKKRLKKMVLIHLKLK